MFRSLKEVMEYTVGAKDGDAGPCKDFLVDAQIWAVRYMVADTRRWLPGRKVLLSPHLLGVPEDKERRIPVNLTREELKASPPLEEHKPVTRGYEALWHEHHGLACYWEGDSPKGMIDEHPLALSLKKGAGSGEDLDPSAEEHLLSVDRTLGFHVRASNGEIGHLGDFLVDRQTWQVCYAIIDTQNWLPGRQVCILVSAIDFIDWNNEEVGVGSSRETIQHSPEYNARTVMDREYQMVLHDYYGWPRYWE